MFLRPAVASLLTVLLAAGSAAGQPCPTTTVTIDPGVPFPVHAASFDTTGGGGGTSYQVVFDLAEGTLESRMTSSSFGQIEIAASDRYRIDALAAGTVDVDAVLEVTAVRLDACGLQCAWAMTRVEWRDEHGRVELDQADTARPGVYHFELVLPVSATIGEPFRLSTVVETQVLGLGANLIARADLTTRLRFDRVPPGARVTSCHGFDSAPTTAVRRSSWGGVKTAYR